MAIEFECHKCKKKWNSPDETAGKKAKCPGCGEIIDIPLPQTLFKGFDDPELVIPTPAAEAPKVVQSASAPAGDSAHPADAGPAQLMDVSDLLNDVAGGPLSGKQPRPQAPKPPAVHTPDSSDGLDFTLEAKEWKEFKPKNDPDSRAPRKKQPKPADAPQTLPAAKPLDAHKTVHAPALAAVPPQPAAPPPPPPPLPPTFYPPSNASAEGAPVAPPNPIVERAGSLMGDCAGAFVYGLRNVGSIIVLVIMLSLVTLGLRIVGVFLGPSIELNCPWVLKVLGFFYLIVNLALLGWTMKLQTDIIELGSDGKNDTPFLAHWDFNDHFMLGLRTYGLAIVYFLPIVTIPLFPLGLLALGRTGDGRAYNLFWAFKSAFKHPGQLILVWLFIIAYIIVAIMAIAAVIAITSVMVARSSHPSVFSILLLSIILILAIFVAGVMTMCICSRCISRLGYRCRDIVESLPQFPDLGKSIAFVVGSLLLSGMIYGSLIASFNEDRQRNAFAAMDALLTSFASAPRSSEEPSSPPKITYNSVPSPSPTPATDEPYTGMVVYNNLRVDKYKTYANVKVDYKTKRFPLFSDSELADFAKRHDVMIKLRTSVQNWKRSHPGMAGQAWEVWQASGYTMTEINPNGLVYRTIPLSFADASNDIVLYSESPIFGGAHEAIQADGEICFIWAEDLGQRLTDESRRRERIARITPTPPPFVSPGITPGPTAPPSPTPPAVEWSAAEQDLITLANALKSYAVKGGNLPATLEELQAEGLVKASVMVSADGKTPMAIVGGIRLSRTHADILAYDPVPVSSGPHAGSIRFIRSTGDPEYLPEKNFQGELTATRARANLCAMWRLMSTFNDKNRRPPVAMQELLDSGLVKDETLTRGIGTDAPRYVIVGDMSWGSSDLAAFDPQAYGGKYFAVTADGDIRLFTSMDSITRDIDFQKERIAIMRRPNPFSTPTPAAGKPAPAIAVVDGKKLMIDWPVDGWTEVAEHPFKDFCQIVREVKEKQYAAIVGVHFGPEAAAKTDKAFTDYRKSIIDFWVSKNVKNYNEGKQKIGDQEYDRINAKDGPRMATVLVGFRSGRCVSFWYVSNTTNVWNTFTKEFDKATVKATGEDAAKPKD